MTSFLETALDQLAVVSTVAIAALACVGTFALLF
jgi:hypothetical protein